MKVITVIGARPQFIKAASISREIRKKNGRALSSSLIQEVIVHTGQHYDDFMSDIFFRELEIPEPHYNLGVGSGSHGWQTGQMLVRIENLLMQEKPDWVLVYGDTNSTLAGALVAAKLQIPIAHVEAGLRSFNRRMPEEINRILVDRVSSLLLCPSETAVENLRREGFRNFANGGQRIPCTANSLCMEGGSALVANIGDVMADTLLLAAEKAQSHSGILQRLGASEKKYLLATVHRPENTDNGIRLSNILEALKILSIHQPVIFPMHPRTKKVLNSWPSSWTSHSPQLKMIEPVGYLDMIQLEKSAQKIITDSGGMQKEAYWLSVPCITLREETEWVETVLAGWNILAGTETSRIVQTVQSFEPPVARPPLYGDGQAAIRCVALMNRRDFLAGSATPYSPLSQNNLYRTALAAPAK